VHVFFSVDSCVLDTVVYLSVKCREPFAPYIHALVFMAMINKRYEFISCITLQRNLPSLAVDSVDSVSLSSPQCT